MKTVDV